MEGLLNFPIAEQQKTTPLTDSPPMNFSEQRQNMQAGARESSLANPLHQQLEIEIEEAVPKELKTPYLRVVTAGMRVMFDPKTTKLMQERLIQGSNIVEAVASGIADLLALLHNESRRQMSIPAAMLAAFTLMAQALDFAEKAGKVQVTKELIAQCTQATWKAATEKFGITQEKINAVIAQSQGQAQSEKASEENVLGIEAMQNPPVSQQHPSEV